MRYSSVLALCVIVSSHVLNCYELHANFLSIGCGARRAGSQEMEIFSIPVSVLDDLGQEATSPSTVTRILLLLSQTNPSKSVKRPGLRQKDGEACRNELVRSRSRQSLPEGSSPARSKVQRKPHQRKRERSAHLLIHLSLHPIRPARPEREAVPQAGANLTGRD